MQHIFEWITLDDNHITNAKLKKQVNYDIEHLPEDSVLDWNIVGRAYNSHWLNQQETIDYQIHLGSYQITVQKINSIVYDVSVYERY